MYPICILKQIRQSNITRSVSIRVDDTYTIKYSHAFTSLIHVKHAHSRRAFVFYSGHAYVSTQNMQDNSTLQLYEVSAVPEIRTQDDLNGATVLLSEFNRKLDTLKEEREKVTKPLNEALKAERARFKPYEDKLTEAVASIKAGMSAFLVHQEEERKKAMESLKAGDTDAVQAVATIAENQSKGAKTDTGSVSFVDVKKWRVVDENLIPREYLTINEDMVKESMKEGKAVPGIEFYMDKQIRNRR